MSVAYQAGGVAQIWHEKKLCPSSEDVSCGGLWPNVARKWCPLLEDFVSQQTLTKCGPIMCPLAEDFVSLRTLNKCGPKWAPCWRTLSHCGLWPNVVRNVPLVKGLYHAVDFNQMWSEHVPLNGGLYFAMESNQIWIDNILIVEQAGTKQTVSERQSTWNWNHHLWLHCHMISTLEGSRTNKSWQKNDASCIHHMTNDKWCRLHTAIINTASYLMRVESILIGFTWTSWNFCMRTLVFWLMLQG